AINLAVERSDPTAHIVILNPDTRVRADALHTLLNGLHDPAVGIVAPRLVEPDGSTQKSLRREPTVLRALGLTRTRLPLLSEYVHDQRAYQTQTDADWAVGAALLVRRECFADLGGWDSSYFLYSEETDFCLRARDRGWLTRLQPTAIVEHIGGGSGRSARTHTMQVINRVRLYRRRNPPLSSWLYYLVTLLNEATRIIRPGDRGRSRAAVLALLRPLRRPAELGCSDRLMPC
ncbi:MAG TPA: glycosyltransferase family 2 protein, partial [Jatrophihabitans sp.]